MTVPGTNGNENNGETPGTLNLGPFYVPESRNEITYEDAEKNKVTEQQYRFTLKLDDTKTDATAPDFDLVIENLKALFRNTHVIININMTEGDVKVYAEIQDWNHKYANGWVTEQ